MKTSLLMAVAAIVFSVVAFIIGRRSLSWQFPLKLRSAHSSDRMPAWLKNYKENWYTRTIYDKVLAFFGKGEPFLNSYLSIMDVAEDLGTNKVYVARAIKVYSDKNFCQFVNAYRIDYAIALNKREPDLKVSDLAYRSGFNSPTAFSIAFKIAKGIPPGEWMRRSKH